MNIEFKGDDPKGDTYSFPSFAILSYHVMGRYFEDYPKIFLLGNLSYLPVYTRTSFSNDSPRD